MLKKLTTIFCKAIVLSIFLVFVGCENLFNQNLIESQSTVSGERKDHLIELALTGNWKSSETEVENAILAILEKEGRSAETSSVKMSKIDEASIVVPAKLNPSRSSIVEECNEINFDLYSLETDDEELYAVTSDDKRVGNVLALVDSEFKSDISNDDFSIMFAECLSNYVLNTVEEWNSITDEDIYVYKDRSAYKDIANSGNYTYSAWKKNYGNTKCILPINWNQNPSPFNDCIIAVKGGDAYYVGCGAIQVAQIMAFHKYAKTTISPNLNTIKNKWSLAKNWDGKYDFNVLTSVKTPHAFSSENLRIQLGAFLYDVAEGCKSTYKSDGTSTYESNRLAYLKSQGYTNSSTSGYSFDNIKKSIDAGCPVPICGQSMKKTTTKNHRFLWWTWTTSSVSYSGGHAFIIDGYYNMTCTATNGSNIITITDNFIHCNTGWGGLRNGYYLSGVMNFGMGPLTNDNTDRSIEGTSYYYQYKLSQTNILKPKVM